MPQTSPKRIAVIASVYHYLSHAQHFSDRFLVGYPHRGRWHRPHMQVVSLYVDQKNAGDQSLDRAREFGFGVYPTIAEALRCGGDRLAVDAVLLIVEHGEYPNNEKNQKQYPRYEMFKACVEVFEKDGHAVPIYVDKNLSYSFPQGLEMVSDARRLGFPVLAGSSLPVTWRLPDLELPLGCRIEEALMVGVGGSDAMDYHALEAMQCMIERRGDGETGIKAVRMIEGEAVWEAGRQGDFSQELLIAALSRSDTPQGLTIRDGRTQDMVGNGELPRIVPHPAAYFIEHRDGLRTTLLMLNGAVGDYCFACRLKDNPTPQSTQFFLPPTPPVTYSACLVSKIEELIETGRSPIPVERTLTVCGILDYCLTSKTQGHVRIETPDHQVIYRAPSGSHHARD
ncbi:MAG: hypothetical protein FJY97_17085 [candidate division Zixibacteria bacterium]|nr:hypothetical protein [candidate division Zixibacteria bacterium]